MWNHTKRMNRNDSHMHQPSQHRFITSTPLHNFLANGDDNVHYVLELVLSSAIWELPVRRTCKCLWIACFMQLASLSLKPTAMNLRRFVTAGNTCFKCTYLALDVFVKFLTSGRIGILALWLLIGCLSIQKIDQRARYRTLEQLTEHCIRSTFHSMLQDKILPLHRIEFWVSVSWYFITMLSVTVNTDLLGTSRFRKAWRSVGGDFAICLHFTNGGR